MLSLRLRQPLVVLHEGNKLVLVHVHAFDTSLAHLRVTIAMQDKDTDVYTYVCMDGCVYVCWLTRLP